jgi:muconolactone delta-isomerase
VDEAIIVAHRVAADNVDAAERARDADEGSAFVVANALRTYLIATAGLYARVGMIEADDEDELWSALSAPVGDTPPA